MVLQELSLLPVLTFHDISTDPAVISFPPGIFRHGLAKLHEHGYRTLSLVDAAQCWQKNQAFPARSFVITFDDGYESVYAKAFPVLQEFAMSATVFLPVGKDKVADLDRRLPALEGRAMLSWRRIQEMHKHGISFGAHTVTHADLTSLPVDEVKPEILTSKQRIEDVLGTAVSSFAYPFGRYNTTIRNFVAQHFTCACSDALGFLNGASDLYAIERVDAYYLRSNRLFNLMLTGFFPSYIKARALPRRLRRRFWQSH